MRQDERLERWRALGIRAWAAIGVLILVAVALMVLVRIEAVIIPFLMAAVLIFLLRAPVAWIERHRAPRWLAVLVCYVIAIAVLTLAGVFIFPVLAAQSAQFLAAFPGYVEQAGRAFTSLSGRYWAPLPSWLRDSATSIQGSVTTQLGDWAKVGATGIVSAGGSVVTFLIDSVLALFIAFYVLVDLPVIRREVVLIAGPRFRPDAEVIVREVSTVLGGYLRGQAIIAVVNGVLTAIGLYFVGIPYSGVIGLITGLLSIIPYVGPVVGAIIVGITGLFISPGKAILGILVLVVVQQVEGNVLSPRIMSREVDLHPALVIFSLLVGAELAGLLGMLIAIPVAATAKALFAHYLGRAEAERPASGAVPRDGGGQPDVPHAEASERQAR